MEQRTWNWIFGIAGGIALILGIVAIIKAYSPKTLSPVDEAGNPKKGLAGAFANIVSNVTNSDWWTSFTTGGKCDPNKLGYTMNGNYNPSKCGYGNVQCDPNKIGYELDGTPNPNCGKAYEGCDYTKCDPNRNGYNQCGLPDINCGFGG